MVMVRKSLLNLGILLSFFLCLAEQATATTTTEHPIPPYVDLPPQWLPDIPNLSSLPQKDVMSYMALDTTKPHKVVKPVKIGAIPQFTTDIALQIVENARKAYDSGVWTNDYTLQDRIRAIKKVIKILEEQEQDKMAETLVWEIGKNWHDARDEFQRTKKFIESLVEQLENDPEFAGHWSTVSSVRAFRKRAAVGVVLALAPYNYPLNECYATIIPALLMGNVVIVKIPTVGGLVHLHTMEAFRQALPKHTIQFLAGSGRATMPPIMETGKIDMLSFIGGSSAADQLIHAHPHPHRLLTFLQLEAKNMAVVLPEVFEDGNASLLEHTVKEITAGTLTYNGQRCTATKIIFVPQTNAETFLEKLGLSIAKLMPVGFPYEQSPVPKVTPLPTKQRLAYMKELLDDAVAKGAKIVNDGGGTVVGGEESTLMEPAVVYPVTSDMRLYHEEQFGPILPVVPYKSLEQIEGFAAQSDFAQQVSIFGTDANAMKRLVDAWGSLYGKININGKPGRSPDHLAFSGRRSSAKGVMSVRDVLLEFSVPTIVAHNKDDSLSNGIVEELNRSTKFLQQPAVAASEGTGTMQEEL